MIEWTKAKPRQKCRHPGCEAKAVVTRGVAGRCEDHKPSVYDAPSIAPVITLNPDSKLPPHLQVILRAAETRLACEAARRRGRMYLASAMHDPASAHRVIAEMVALLEQAPAATSGLKREGVA